MGDHFLGEGRYDSSVEIFCMYLFLDFDGVLHPVGADEADYFSRLGLLERFLLAEAPSWRVVISSSWRDYFALPELVGRFGAGLRPRIDGCTPSADDKRVIATWGAQASLYPREVEIRHYLASHQLSTQEWVAIDDHGSWFRDPQTNPHLVLTDPAVGITEQTIEQLRRRLR